MLFDVLGWVMLDGLATVMNSPFVIPVAGCVMILGMTASSMWAKVRSEEIKSHERLARIAKGLPADLPGTTASVSAMESVFGSAAAATPRVDRSNDGGKARRAGVVLVSIGLGLFLFFAALAAIVQVREVLAGGAAGLIPLAIGIGFLVDSRIKKAEYERRLTAGWYPQPGLGAGAGQAPAAVPPPPPVGISAAQASDWRPLH